MSLLDPARYPHLKFGIGQSPTRKDDIRLLTGGGRFTDDIDLDGQAYGHFVRSPHAHGKLLGVDTDPVRAVPGVLAVYTGADLAAAGYGVLHCPLPLKSHDGAPLAVPPWHSLAVDRVRFVGEPVALVVAETAAAARDGAEAVGLDLDPLPAVVDPMAAAGDDAPRLFAQTSNVCLDWRYGDFEAVEQVFRGAAHVTRLELANNRIVIAAMEPRVAIAEYDAGRFTLHVASQGVMNLRHPMAEPMLGVEPDRLRVRTYDVGGSFGMKATPYPEYVPLLHAARALGRPVKWCDARSESFVSDYHGRDSDVVAELALDTEGIFLAVRVTGIANMGAYLTTYGPYVPTATIVRNLPGVYRTPHIAVAAKCVFTNTTPTGPYRGAGRPEANYYMERLIDAAARQTGRDPVALRRMNMIPPDAMPYAAPSGLEYDSGDFEAVLDACLDKSDWDGFPERRADSEARGLLRGIGIACYLEATAAPAREMGGVRFVDAGVEVVTGTQNYGQGHASTIAHMLVEALGVGFDEVHLCQGDSDQLLAGGGSGGSRSTMTASTAVLAAVDEAIAKGHHLAAHFLEAAAADIEFDDGRFRIVGTDRSIGVLELAARSRAEDLPDGLPQTLDSALVNDNPPSAFPNGCHVVEVEIDPDTGVVALARYTVVDDFGTLVNPDLVEGQVHGGIVQGLGQALMERTRYGTDGQFITGSFLDYALPRADHVPDIGFASQPVPATTNRLGVKGCGEAGTTGALPGVMNAISDALAARGAAHLDMPASPERVWAALAAAPTEGAADG